MGTGEEAKKGQNVTRGKKLHLFKGRAQKRLKCHKGQNRTCSKLPSNISTSGSEHAIFWQVSTINVVPAFSSSFHELIILNWIFLHWACNLLKFSMSCSQSAIRIIVISLGEYAFNNVVCTSRVIQFLPQTSVACSSK